MLPIEQSDSGYENLVSLGKKLCQALDTVPNSIVGINKLRRKIWQEIYALEKAKQSNSLKKEQLTCSNLHHYEAFVENVTSDSHCVSVLEGYTLEDAVNGRKKIYVDIVTEQKRRWKKVIARNPKALSQISEGDGEYQQKSIVDHANEFLACAKQNLVFFKPPVVEFVFACGIESWLAETLTSLGILVSGEVIGAPCSSRASSSPPYGQKNKQNPTKYKGKPMTSIQQATNPPAELGKMDIKKVNLDVTAMIAYVSALTNGHADRKIRGKILNQHAEWERLSPVKPVLDKFFEGKELYACERAMSDFKSILEVIGGEGEVRRGEELIASVRVVPDAPLEGLQPRGQIKERGLAVFGTGRHIRAITVTANSSFLRAALTNGIHLDVFLHEPRSLTEQKEIIE